MQKTLEKSSKNKFTRFQEESNYVWEMTSELTDIKDSKKEPDSNNNSLPHQ